MKLWSWVILAGIIASRASPAPPNFSSAQSLNDPEGGQRLAAELRSFQPAEPSEFRGVFRIRQPRQEVRVLAIRNEVALAPTNWLSIYEARFNGMIEQLIVAHAPNQPNRYQVSRGNTNTTTVPRPLGTNELWQPFAGSDFFYGDLGLEFFHWPGQRLIKAEMRKGRGCRVLESIPGTVQSYSKVLSWVDIETSGLILAEAYDAAGKLWKEFEIKSGKEIKGQWQVQKLEIRDLLKNSRTLLEFNFSSE